MKKILLIVFALMALLVASAGAAAYWVASSVNMQTEHSHAAEYIKIDKGSTPRQIINQLSAAGIIADPTAASIYLRFAGDSSKLQAGEFQFPSPISAAQVFKLLEKGQEQTIKLTIPEGFTRFDIAKRMLEKLPHDNSLNESALIDLMNDTSMIKDIAPTASNLEGYLYPTTYNVPRDAKPQEVVKMMVEQFRKFWKPEWAARAASMNRTPHQIVTIASLIETETGVESERPIVAGVINNRLVRNIPLGIDQTNVYIAKMLGRWDGVINKSDLEVDSPYNTRIKVGLPPGPISSVTESSIKAALNPDVNNYLFYVRNVDLNDGSHWFYSSAADFEKGKVKYQLWLEQQRKEMRANQANTQ